MNKITVDISIIERAIDNLEYALGFSKNMPAPHVAKLTATKRVLEAELAKPRQAPCKGPNCGSTNGRLHSAACFDAHDKSCGVVNNPVITKNIEVVLLEDMAEGSHPSYGRGLFATYNCVKSINIVEDEGIEAVGIEPKPELSRMEMQQEWKAAGGEVHGPRVETVTMPEDLYFKFRQGITR